MHKAFTGNNAHSALLTFCDFISIIDVSVFCTMTMETSCSWVSFSLLTNEERHIFNTVIFLYKAYINIYQIHRNTWNEIYVDKTVNKKLIILYVTTCQCDA